MVIRGTGFGFGVSSSGGIKTVFKCARRVEETTKKTQKKREERESQQQQLVLPKIRNVRQLRDPINLFERERDAKEGEREEDVLAGGAGGFKISLRWKSGYWIVCKSIDHQQQHISV